METYADLKPLGSKDDGTVVSYTVKYKSQPKTNFIDMPPMPEINRPKLRHDAYYRYIDLWRLVGYYNKVELYCEDGTPYEGPLTWCQDGYHVDVNHGPTDEYWRYICRPNMGIMKDDEYREYGGMPQSHLGASFLCGEFCEGETYTIVLTAVNTMLKKGDMMGMMWSP